MGQIRPATKDDSKKIAPHLRDADKREVKAYTGLPPSAPLLQWALDQSDRSWALETSEGELAAILGTQPVYEQPGVGYVWLVGTPHLQTHRVEFLRGCKEHLPTIFGPYDLLTNFVDERNTLHIRWLRWLGFSTIKRLPQYGAEGLPFLHFVGIKPEQCAHPLLQP
jgi:hypothetical protein